MAGRNPQPWWWAAKGTWAVHIDGKRVRLGPDKEEAFTKFYALMAQRGQAPPPPALTGATTPLTVRQLVDLYMEGAPRRVKPCTLRVTGQLLESFAGTYGSLPAAGVKVHHADAWVRANPSWSRSTEGLAKAKLRALFTWGTQQGFLRDNPVRGIKIPRARSRGPDTLVSPDAYSKLVGAACPALADVLVALWETGARPGEVTSVTAQDFDPERGLWVLRDNHKTAHKTGRARVVYLTPPVVEICKRLAQRHPRGPLFRTQRGTPYGWCGLSKRLSLLCRRLGLPKGITPYSFRHTLATDALAKGVGEALVAQLMGHHGTGMLHHHYNHLVARPDALVNALGQARGNPNPPS